MIWLAWRQQRFPMIAAAVLVAIYAALAIGSRQDAELVTITQLFAGYLTVGVCMFWGAPLLAREIEQGTHHLAWTQSKSRFSWLTARLVVAGIGALLATAAVTAIITVLLPPSADHDPMTWYYYESHGLLPFARVLFALALGCSLGALIRHTHIAMAVCAPILGVVQLGGARAVRESIAMTFWQLQAAESAIYTAMAALLILGTYMIIRYFR